MDNFDSIVAGDKVEVIGGVVVTVTRKIISWDERVMGWATDDVAVTVTRKNFIRICGKDK